MTYRPNGLPVIRIRQPLFCGLVVICAMLWAMIANAQESNVGSGKRQYRVQALQSIPFHQLNQQTKDKLNGVLKNPSIYRRLPITTINSDPDYYRFLVRYPEVLVDIWQLMGVTKMSTQRTGPFTVACDDGVGTKSTLDLVYGNDNLHIFYGTGSYEGPFLRKKLFGSCVLILHSNFAVGADGKPNSTSQLDVFLKVENAALGLIAKTIQPIVGTTADHNFVESLKFVQRLNETTEQNGPGIQRMATRLDLDQDVRQKFVDVAGLVYERSGGPLSTPTFLGSFVPGGSPHGGQYVMPRQGEESVPNAGQTHKAISPDARTGVPFSSFEQPVLVTTRQSPDGRPVHQHFAGQCNPCIDGNAHLSGGPAAAYQAASQSATARAYGYQAPDYTPVYQAQPVSQPPVAYQADAFRVPGYPSALQTQRR